MDEKLTSENTQHKNLKENTPGTKLMLLNMAGTIIVFACQR